MEKVNNAVAGTVSKAGHFLQEPPYTQQTQFYLVGLRGFMVIQSFIWVFLQVFVPVAVKDSLNGDNGPFYQQMLRKTLSVLFWNETLIYSTMIMLSARMICLPFLTAPSRVTLASSVMRRGLRLWFPVCVALGISYGAFSSLGVQYIKDFFTATGNISARAPYLFPTTLAYWNSVFEIFWVNKNFADQSGSYGFPSALLWMISVIYQQSYTVYVVMVVIPYTRKTWRVVGGACMIITAWWVQSWAWYSVTGLLLADAVLHMNLMQKSAEGIPLGKWIGFKKTQNFVLPSWVPYGILVVAGLFMQYFYTAWRPDLLHKEEEIHTGLYYTGGLNKGAVPGQPAARDDNYVFLLGFFLFLETTAWMQRAFNNPLFVYLGKRSLSYFLIQGTIIYTGGIKLQEHLIIQQHTAFEAATTATLFTCLALTVIGAELFYRIVDQPSRGLARFVWEWIITP